MYMYTCPKCGNKEYGFCSENYDEEDVVEEELNRALQTKVEQKPVWSEEDETTKNNISHIIRQYDKISKRENKPCWYIGDCLLWMQNIKDRVLPQQKQEWSEEDESLIYNIEQDYKDKLNSNPHEPLRPYYNKVIHWLKSLRPQKQWKPTEEQMDALYHVSKGLVCGKSDCEALNTLYGQLKEL